MGLLLSSSNDTVKQIITEVENLSIEEQKRVLLRLRKGELAKVAKQLSKTVKPNKNSTQQTIEAVRKWQKIV